MVKIVKGKSRVEALVKPATHAAKSLYLLNQLCDLECPKPIQHNQFYKWMHHLKLFGFGGAVKQGDKGDEYMNDNGVCSGALALTGSCKYSLYALLKL